MTSYLFDCCKNHVSAAGGGQPVESAPDADDILMNDDAPIGGLKVVTENGIVYLMGLATQVEGQRIADSASGVDGVQKVVRLFEYID